MEYLSRILGKGIANEAAAAVMHYAFEVRREPKVRALIASSNTSSRRVAERLGIRYDMKPSCTARKSIVTCVSVPEAAAIGDRMRIGKQTPTIRIR